DGPQHRIGPWRLLDANVQGMRHDVGDECCGQAEQRRCRQVHPELDELVHLHSQGNRRQSRRSSSAVAASPSRVESTTTSIKRTPYCETSARCAITPTPTGTNSKDRWLSSASAA